MDVEREIISIIAEVSGFETEEISMNSSLEDLDIDSIRAIEITVALEKKFKISIRDEDVPEMRTVKAAIDKVNQLLNG
ncbi:MAG: acyl carrier protein [Nitrospirota bacterium]|nr:MAG: acyl carrier protein [Nitrospirota bacterium]